MPPTRPTVAGTHGLVLLRRQLLAWYAHGKRDLPWRRTRDPWAILVSEVMLQQTRVNTVVPYYERFLARWPGPADLARAGEAELLGAWAGLGYYGRARRLHQTACLVADAGGALPGDAQGLSALPGVGAYTAAAVASIAFGEPVPVLDGNVRRVIARLLALPGDPTRGDTGRAVARAAGELLDRRRPGDFNQAMMELGAVCCVAARPRCEDCPLGADCLAHASGHPERFPRPALRPAVTVVKRLVAVLMRGGKVLLARRDRPPNEGFLELPGLEVPPATTTDLQGHLQAHLAARHGLRVRLTRALPVHPHSITRYRIHVHPFTGTLSSGRVKAPLCWRLPGEPDLPLTTATRRILGRTRTEPPS